MTIETRAHPSSDGLIAGAVGRYIAEPGTAREITWWISDPVKYFKLVDLIYRACGDSENAA